MRNKGNKVIASSKEEQKDPELFFFSVLLSLFLGLVAFGSMSVQNVRTDPYICYSYSYPCIISTPAQRQGRLYTSTMTREEEVELDKEEHRTWHVAGCQAQAPVAPSACS